MFRVSSYFFYCSSSFQIFLCNVFISFHLSLHSRRLCCFDDVFKCSFNFVDPFLHFLLFLFNLCVLPLHLYNFLFIPEFFLFFAQFSWILHLFTYLCNFCLSLTFSNIFMTFSKLFSYLRVLLKLYYNLLHFL